MVDLELGPLRFGVVGAGRLGLAMTRALQARDFEVVHVSSRTAAGCDRAAHVLGVPAFEDPLAACALVDCVLLCVPDDALPAVVEQLSLRDPHASPMRLRIISTSAAGGLTALAPLGALGHDVGVLHPVASLTTPDGDASAFRGAGAAIGTADPASRTFAHALAHAMDMVPFDLEERAWPVHAAACTFAAGLVGTVATAAIELAAVADVHEGIARAAYGHLAVAAAERVRSGDVVVPGAVSRGDIGSIDAQVRAVRQHASRYEELCDAGFGAAINAAFVAGHLDMTATRRLTAALGAAMNAPVAGYEGGVD